MHHAKNGAQCYSGAQRPKQPTQFCVVLASKVHAANLARSVSPTSQWWLLGMSGRHEVLSAPNGLDGSSIRTAIPKMAQGLTNVGLKFLAVTADLHFPVLIPGIQQVPCVLERQITPVFPFDEVAPAAQAAIIVISGPVHVGGWSLEHGIALELPTSMHRKYEHHFLAFPDGCLYLAICIWPQRPQARGDRHIDGSVGASLDDEKSTMAIDSVPGAHATRARLTAACRAQR